MSEVMKIKGDSDSAMRDALRFLLESGKVYAVFAPGKIGEDISYFLVSDPKELENIYPALQFMPENSANILAGLASAETDSGKIAVVVKPCELRAFVELVKRGQAEQGNLIFISPVCGGVLRFEEYNNGSLDKAIADYWTAFSKKENPPAIRKTCSACEHFIPYNADITVSTSDNGCDFYLHTKKASELFAESPWKSVPGEFDSGSYDKLSKARKLEKEKLFEELRLENLKIKGLVETYLKCLGCHGCSRICPICYCELCAFDSRENEFVPDVFESELTKRGAMRIPPNTVFFHLGRMAHMAISCVACGMCSEVCPVDIPVSSILLRVGDAIQKVFEYVPGKDVAEPVPLSTFIEQELEEVED